APHTVTSSLALHDALPISAAASLGQVHAAVGLGGERLACKLQYPDMDSAVEADLNQLALLFAVHRRMQRAIDTTEILQEISARVDRKSTRLNSSHVKISYA